MRQCLVVALVDHAGPLAVVIAARFQHSLANVLPPTASSRCSQRDATVGVAPLRMRAGKDQLARAAGHLEIMRQLTDPPLRRLQADLGLHRPRQEGIVGGLARPGAFVQAAENSEIDALQARFQRAEDEHAGMAHGPRLDRLARRQRRHDVDPLRPVRVSWPSVSMTSRSRRRQRIAGFTGPERGKAAVLVDGDGLQARPVSFRPFGER